VYTSQKFGLKDNKKEHSSIIYHPNKSFIFIRPQIPSYYSISMVRTFLLYFGPANLSISCGGGAQRLTTEGPGQRQFGESRLSDYWNRPFSISPERPYDGDAVSPPTRDNLRTCSTPSRSGSGLSSNPCCNLCQPKKPYLSFLFSFD
jgi:hypothetical protein